MSSSEVSSSSVSSLDSDEFIVEMILGKKRDGPGGKLFYLIKWEGYGDEDNSWEPRDNISPTLVLDYERMLKERRKKSQQQPSKSSAGDKDESSGEQLVSKKRQLTSGGDKMKEKRVKMIERTTMSSSSSSVSSLASDEFIVERILSKKREGTGGKLFYLIKWQGYGDEDNSWEPRDNIHPTLVFDFERNLKEGKKKNQPEPSKSSTGDRKETSAKQLLSKKRQMSSGGDRTEEKRVKMGGDHKSSWSQLIPVLKDEEATGHENGAGGEVAAAAEGGQEDEDGSNVPRYREVTPFVL